MNGHFNLGALTPTRYFFGIAIVLGLLFGLIGPDDDSLSGLVQSLVVWQLHTLISMSLLVSSHTVLSHVSAFERLNPWLQLLLSGLLGVLLFTPIALVMDYIFTWNLDEKGTLAWELLDEVSAAGPPVLICWMAINAPWVLGFRLTKHDEHADRGAGQASSIVARAKSPKDYPAANFTCLVPEDIRGEIRYLKAELHYLSVVTTQGQSLILYNLRDAIKELPAELGIQCHRSYWVAWTAIDGLTRNGRQGELRLIDGGSVPVSRARLSELASALGQK